LKNKAKKRKKSFSFRVNRTCQRLTLLTMITDRIWVMTVRIESVSFEIDFCSCCLVLCPDLVAERPREHESLGNIIVVDNLPKVDQTKLEKLKAVVSKVYSKIGVVRKEYYPLDDEGKTKGYFVLIFV